MYQLWDYVLALKIWVVKGFYPTYDEAVQGSKKCSSGFYIVPVPIMGEQGVREVPVIPTETDNVLSAKQ